jgi:hypothetical protein
VKRWVMVVPAAAFFLVLVIALAVSGCSQYGEVSKDAYDIALALHLQSRRQTPMKLPELTERIDTAEAEGRLNSRESRWLKAILRDAEAGDWERVTAASRSLMEAQIQR